MSDKSVVLYPGDCVEQIKKNIATASVDALIADPPYGMDYQSSWTIGAKRKPKIANDKLPYIWWLSEAFRVLKDGGALYSFSDWRNSESFRYAIDLAGFTVRSQGIWDRNAHGMGDLVSQLAPQHDVVWFATKGKFKFPGSRPKSVFRSTRISGDKLIHPNQKPVDLLEQMIVSITVPDDVVLDPFMGVGSTGVAAVNTGRRFVGIELDSGYFTVASERISNVRCMTHDSNVVNRG
jgi:DNA modification methylase